MDFGPQLSAVDIIYTGRVLERLLIVLFGGLCLVLGFKLFDRAGASDGELEAQGSEKLFLRLRNVGPGVFFALFGAAILVISLVYQIEVNSNQMPATGVAGADRSAPVERASVSVRHGQAPLTQLSDTRERQIAALSVLLDYAVDFRSTVAGAEADASLFQAVDIASGLRGDLLDERFGEGAHARYVVIANRRAENPSFQVTKLPADERSSFFEMDELMTGNMPD